LSDACSCSLEITSQTQEQAMDRLAYSINETARALSLGRTSVYAMISDGRLEAFKLGRRTLVKAASVRRLVEGQE
jgi:excisionase family DNA binding protein